jgi:rSAM/selenodomain-associated transferase 2
MRLSIIIPVLNEANCIADLLRAIAPLRARGCEIIVADGGSTDGTMQIAAPYADSVIQSIRGRAHQMNAGAADAKGDILLFLHADTQLPPKADQLIATALANGALWGRFDVKITGQSRWLPIIAAMMNLRSRMTGIATGDQAMFMTRGLFIHIGGFPSLPLMEDITLSGLLKRVVAPACLRAKVTTSGRRWDQHGALRTIVLMWRLRFAYWRGADIASLARVYGYIPAEKRDATSTKI